MEGGINGWLLEVLEICGDVRLKSKGSVVWTKNEGFGPGVCFQKALEGEGGWLQKVFGVGEKMDLLNGWINGWRKLTR